MEEGKAVHTTRALPFRFLNFFLLFLVLCSGFLIIGLNMFHYFGLRDVRQPAESSSNRCFTNSMDLSTWIMPPYSLLHTMNDSELFWRASFVPQIKKYPFRRIPKIAFMFLTKGPLPLAPLWERFLRGHEDLYSIYIHSLPSYKPNYATASPFYMRQIPSKVVEWGRISMCDGERRLLANALLDISNEWFILLSESCIPLHNFNIVYRYISRSKTSFMDSFDLNDWSGRGRYNNNMMPHVTIDQWRKGSQWFEVNRHIAITIIEDTIYYSLFDKFCRPGCYVDEHYFPTMLNIKSPWLLANRSLTWVDWSRGGAHPATYGSGDINREFFRKNIFEGHSCLYNNQPSTLCYMFARKFAPNALERLLEIESDAFQY